MSPGFWPFFGITTGELERQSPAASRIRHEGEVKMRNEGGDLFVLWQYNVNTGTAISGGQLDFRSLAVQLLVLERQSPAASWIFVRW